MRFDTLAANEAAFRNRKDYILTPFSAPVQGEDLTLTGLFCKPKSRTGYFNTPEPPPAKQRIVLHFTAGDLSGGISTLTMQDRHVSVPFVLARDGTVYQLFPSKYWSGNLGKGIGNIGTNNLQDKITIGIEIINFGYLIERGGNLETIYSKPGQPDTYCKLTQTQAYQKLAVPFRNQRYYASYTPQQYDSLIILLRFLTRKYNIPRTFLAESNRYEATNDVLSFKGIVSHVNYRGKNRFGGFEKWDIGPAFDWKTLIAGVQAARYTPVFAQRSLSLTEEVITSEEQMEQMLGQPRGVEVAPPDEFDANLGDDATDEMGNNNVAPKLFALLIGINQYERFPLGGCVNDMNAMEDYLRQKTGFDHQILTIQDKKATKQAIVTGFREHLSKASPTDTVLFYFSGHGTQENADPIWTTDTDEGLECLVCYNGNTQKSSDYLLADKELRYLIHDVSEKTGAHVVTMFDCCHSGDNTRSMATEVFRGADTNERRVWDRNSEFFPKRAWDGFIFSDVIPYEEAKKSPGAFLPEGAHVQLSACESDEVALEVGGQGVFTKNLLKVLEKAGGDISYQSLRSRVRQYMKFGFDQKPKISVVLNTGLLDSIFLNQRLDRRKSTGEMIFNETKQAWLLNLGAIHGAKAGSSVQIVDPKRALETVPASIDKVFIDHSIITTDGLKLSQTDVYKVLTDSLMVEEIKLFLHNANGNQAELNPLVEALLAASGGCYVFEENETNADFTLHIQTGQCYVTRPNDPFRPLFMPVPLDDANKEISLANALKHISRWQYVQKLENQAGNTPSGDLLKIAVSQVDATGTEKALPVTASEAKPVYEKIGDTWKGKLKINVTNQSTRKLYFSVYYLPNDFSVSLDLMNNRVTLLEPGKSVDLSYKNNNEIPLTLERIVREYNWPKSIETLKFLVSSQEFDPEGFVQAGLPLPPVSSNTDRARGETGRGIGEEEDEKAINIDFWQTQTLTLEYENPEYNRVNQPWLDKLLAYEPLAEFVFGLYYDIVTDEFGQPKPVLKPELIVPPGERGLLDDAKLWTANKVEQWRRNRQYYQVKNSRKRIVAQGDSWFLYPFFVQEILDHLSVVYAVKSLAAAGDTLENYILDDKYVAAIDDENPALYLVSGGGNDILGKQFKDYLRTAADVPRGSAPEAYLNEAVSEKIDQLHGWYVEMFDKIRSKHPDLPILFHGYDYPIPVDTEATPDKTSWLGKYMIEKGIGGQDLRASIIKHLMDRFNEKMMTLADDQRKIYFIDVRNSVTGSENWYDEIHPGTDSFRNIALKFMDKINEVMEA